MKHIKTLRLLAALLALLLLCGCTAVGPAGEQPGTAPEVTPSAPEENVITVSTVDELLAAIGPNRTIELAAGTYNLSQASDYGTEGGSNYTWERLYGYESDRKDSELQIRSVEGLTLRGAGRGETVIEAVPRYVNVISFIDCPDLRVEGITAGHTTAPGVCSGGVLDLRGCSDVSIDGCGLFGCGTVGVWATECNGITVTDTQIYECSYAAVAAESCRNVLVDGCEVYRNGIKGSSAYSLFSASSCDSFAVTNCSIHENAMQILLYSSYSQNTLFLSNKTENNMVSDTAFVLGEYPATVDGCSFTDNMIYAWASMLHPADAEGTMLDDSALAAMTYRELDPADVKQAEPAAPLEVPAGGEVTVTTADEFLSAIGPDRTIVLDGKLFDLSTASNYGSGNGAYYYWEQSYDGPGLVITGVSGLTIKGGTDDPRATTLVAVPRYADVLSFRACDQLSLVGFTAGHTVGADGCSGGVLDFSGCKEINVEACRLYGCGVMGIYADRCSDITAQDCEIYDCTIGGVSFNDTDGIHFFNCDIHDVPSPAVSVYGCSEIFWEKLPVENGSYDILDGALIEPGSVSQSPDSIKVYQGENEVTELTLKLGERVRLDALAFPLELYNSAWFSWETEAEEALSLIESGDSKSCRLEALQLHSGALTLTVSCGEVQKEILIYIVEG